MVWNAMQEQMNLLYKICELDNPFGDCQYQSHQRRHGEDTIITNGAYRINLAWLSYIYLQSPHLAVEVDLLRILSPFQII